MQNKYGFAFVPLLYIIIKIGVEDDLVVQKDDDWKTDVQEWLGEDNDFLEELKARQDIRKLIEQYIQQYGMPKGPDSVSRRHSDSDIDW